MASQRENEMSEAIVKRLPADSLIGLTNKNGAMQITISMTLTDPGHARALIEAIEVALLPLLELRVKPPESSESHGPSGERC